MVPMVSYDQKVTPCLVIIILTKYAIVSLMMWMMAPMISHHQKSSVVTCFNCLDLTNVMLLLMMPSSGADDIAGQKSHITPCVKCLCLTQKILPLISHDADTSASGMT